MPSICAWMRSGTRRLSGASIEDVREPQIDWWSATGEIHRLYYLVTTNRGLIAEIYRDLVDDGWFVSRTLD